jgi:thiol:disulfide interchange protein
MNKKTWIVVLAILIIPVLVYWGMSSKQNASVVAEARTEKPQIYKFSSSMCLECKEVEKIFKEIMPKYQDQIDYTEIMVDSRSDMKNALIKKYNVKLVPTVVMLNTDGSVSSRTVGAKSKEEFESCIKELK